MKKPENRFANVSLAAKPTAIPTIPAEASQPTGFTPQIMSSA
jgi:hypothetical protein